MNRLRQIWENLHGSFWFIPSLLVFGALVAGVVIVELDHRIEGNLAELYPRIFGTGSDGAKGILESIATSVITVAGITFSITILILNEASSQYSPRVLRNFIRDRRNQFVLGAFLAVFVYCLVVLRAIHDLDEETFIPYIAVLVSIILAIVSIGVLIYFIHHIAYSIQATTILENVAEETLEAIDHLYPEEIGADAEEESAQTPHPKAEWQVIEAASSGYLSYVDPESLMEVAEKKDLVLRLHHEVGQFVIEKTPFLSVVRDTPLTGDEKKELRTLLGVRPYRTIEQDASFGLRQLVDIALKALSPSLNDTTTANMSLDRIASILTRLIRRKIEPAGRSREGKLRVIAPRPGFADYLHGALEQIREHSRGNISILRQMNAILELLGSHSDNPDRLLSLRKELQKVRGTVEQEVSFQPDQECLLGEIDRTLTKLLEKLERLRAGRLTS